MRHCSLLLEVREPKFPDLELSVMNIPPAQRWEVSMAKGRTPTCPQSEHREADRHLNEESRFHSD